MKIQPSLELRGQPVLGKADVLGLTGVFAALADLSPVFRETIAAWRALIAGELRGGYWLQPFGGKMPHAPRHAFGTQQPQPTLLGPAYAGAWSGGAGSITGIGARTAFFGVSGSRFPVSHLHRGGSGEISPGLVTGKGLLVSSAAQMRPWKETQGRRQWGHPQKWALWWAVAAMRGMRLTGATLTRGLFTPFRPHATVNPKAAGAMSDAAKRRLIMALGVTGAA